MPGMQRASTMEPMPPVKGAELREPRRVRSDNDMATLRRGVRKASERLQSLGRRLLRGAQRRQQATLAGPDPRAAGTSRWPSAQEVLGYGTSRAMLESIVEQEVQRRLREIDMQRQRHRSRHYPRYDVPDADHHHSHHHSHHHPSRPVKEDYGFRKAPPPRRLPPRRSDGTAASGDPTSPRAAALPPRRPRRTDASTHVAAPRSGLRKRLSRDSSASGTSATPNFALLRRVSSHSSDGQHAPYPSSVMTTPTPPLSRMSGQSSLPYPEERRKRRSHETDGESLPYGRRSSKTPRPRPSDVLRPYKPKAIRTPPASASKRKRKPRAAGAGVSTSTESQFGDTNSTFTPHAKHERGGGKEEEDAAAARGSVAMHTPSDSSPSSPMPRADSKRRSREGYPRATLPDGVGIPGSRATSVGGLAGTPVDEFNLSDSGSASRSDGLPDIDTSPFADHASVGTADMLRHVGDAVYGDETPRSGVGGSTVQTSVSSEDSELRVSIPHTQIDHGFDTPSPASDAVNSGGNSSAMADMLSPTSQATEGVVTVLTDSESDGGAAAAAEGDDSPRAETVPDEDDSDELLAVAGDAAEEVDEPSSPPTSPPSASQQQQGNPYARRRDSQGKVIKSPRSEARALAAAAAQAEQAEQVPKLSPGSPAAARLVMQEKYTPSPPPSAQRKARKRPAPLGLKVKSHLQGAISTEQAGLASPQRPAVPAKLSSSPGVGSGKRRIRRMSSPTNSTRELLMNEQERGRHTAKLTTLLGKLVNVNSEFRYLNRSARRNSFVTFVKQLSATQEMGCSALQLFENAAAHMDEAAAQRLRCTRLQDESEGVPAKVATLGSAVKELERLVGDSETSVVSCAGTFLIVRQRKEKNHLEAQLTKLTSHLAQLRACGKHMKHLCSRHGANDEVKRMLKKASKGVERCGETFLVARQLLREVNKQEKMLNRLQSSSLNKQLQLLETYYRSSMAAEEAAKQPKPKRSSRSRSPLAMGPRIGLLATGGNSKEGVEDDGEAEESEASGAGDRPRFDSGSSQPPSPKTFSPKSSNSRTSRVTTTTSDVLSGFASTVRSFRDNVNAFERAVRQSANNLALTVPHVLAIKLKALRIEPEDAKRRAHRFLEARSKAREAYRKLVDIQSLNKPLLSHPDGSRARDAVADALAAVDTANEAARDITPTEHFDCVPLQAQSQSLLVAVASDELVDTYTEAVDYAAARVTAVHRAIDTCRVLAPKGAAWRKNVAYGFGSGVGQHGQASSLVSAVVDTFATSKPLFGRSQKKVVNKWKKAARTAVLQRQGSILERGGSSFGKGGRKKAPRTGLAALMEAAADPAPAKARAPSADGQRKRSQGSRTFRALVDHGTLLRSHDAGKSKAYMGLVTQLAQFTVRYHRTLARLKRNVPHLPQSLRTPLQAALKDAADTLQAASTAFPQNTPTDAAAKNLDVNTMTRIGKLTRDASFSVLLLEHAYKRTLSELRLTTSTPTSGSKASPSNRSTSAMDLSKYKLASTTLPFREVDLSAMQGQHKGNRLRKTVSESPADEVERVATRKDASLAFPREYSADDSAVGELVESLAPTSGGRRRSSASSGHGVLTLVLATQPQPVAKASGGSQEKPVLPRRQAEVILRKLEHDVNSITSPGPAAGVVDMLSPTSPHGPPFKAEGQPAREDVAEVEGGRRSVAGSVYSEDWQPE